MKLTTCRWLLFKLILLIFILPGANAATKQYDFSPAQTETGSWQASAWGETIYSGGGSQISYRNNWWLEVRNNTARVLDCEGRIDLWDAASSSLVSRPSNRHKIASGSNAIVVKASNTPYAPLSGKDYVISCAEIQENGGNSSGGSSSGSTGSSSGNSSSSSGAGAFGLSGAANLSMSGTNITVSVGAIANNTNSSSGPITVEVWAGSNLIGSRSLSSLSASSTYTNFSVNASAAQLATGSYQVKLIVKSNIGTDFLIFDSPISVGGSNSQSSSTSGQDDGSASLGFDSSGQFGLFGTISANILGADKKILRVSVESIRNMADKYSGVITLDVWAITAENMAYKIGSKRFNSLSQNYAYSNTQLDCDYSALPAGSYRVKLVLGSENLGASSVTLTGQLNNAGPGGGSSSDLSQSGQAQQGAAEASGGSSSAQSAAASTANSVPNVSTDGAGGGGGGCSVGANQLVDPSLWALMLAALISLVYRSKSRND